MAEVSKEDISTYGSISPPAPETDDAPQVAETTQEADQSEPEDQWEINKVYDHIGVGKAQYLFWSVSFLIAYSDYSELTLIAIIIPYLRCEWDLTQHFEATITITIFLVYALSALLCGKLSDIYGRRKVMSFSTVILILTAIGAAFAQSKWSFLIWRSIAGACIGANFATVVVYSTEFSPSRTRTVGPVVALMGSYVSMLAVNVMGYIFLNWVGWRYVILIITAPVVPAWILLMVLPESPRYLCVSGKQEEALKAVKFMARMNGVELPDNLSIFCHQNKELGSFKMVLGLEAYRKPAVLLSLMYFSNIFIETALLVFLPLAFISQFCGASGSPPDRNKCQPLSQEDLWKLVGSACGSLVGCMAAYFVAAKIGRLKPLRGSNIMQILVFFLMFVCVNNSYLFGVATGIKIINAFVCMMIWLIVPESFPTIIRNTATGMINSSGKIGAVVGTAMVYILFYASPIAVVMCFLLVALLTTVCSFIFNRETQDVELLET